jgi:hypothetical protein
VFGVPVITLGSPPAIMLAVALLLMVVAVAVLTRPVASDMAVYARRIIGTMLGAGAIILGEFAFVMQNSAPVK